MARETTADRLRIQQQAQRQDSLTDQLRDLHIVAARLGMYDAADWLWKTMGEGQVTILQVIRPIITRTYGESEHSRALAERLAGRIGAWASDDLGDLYGLTRERAIALICWDWMTGGTTASAVAARIEAALLEAGY